MLAGLRSRWTIPFSCAASSASAIWCAIASASRSGAPAHQAVGEGRPLDQLEDQGSHTVGFLQSVDRADVGVVERRQQARLAREARSTLGVGREMRRQDLYRDVASELVVARAIDLAHAAGAERRNDRVRSKLTADHLTSAVRSRPTTAIASAAGASRNCAETPS